MTKIGLPNAETEKQLIQESNVNFHDLKTWMYF